MSERMIPYSEYEALYLALSQYIKDDIKRLKYRLQSGSSEDVSPEKIRKYTEDKIQSLEIRQDFIDKRFSEVSNGLR